MCRIIVVVLALMNLPAAAVEIIAHRGYSARAPENTVAAFRAAWEAGADACELDLHLTADGQIVVLHDKDTQRTTGTALLVAKAKLADLLQLDAGSWKGGAWRAERLPTLEQALATLPQGQRRFFLEVKCGPEVMPALRWVLEPMKARGAQLALIAFRPEVCAAARKELPWLKVYQLASGKDSQKKPRTDLGAIIQQAKAAGLDGLSLGADWPWDEALVRQVREAGLGLYVWTINAPEAARRLAALGVDGITTDDPVLIREALGRAPREAGESD